MYILGLNSFIHDSSACLIHNNEMVAYAEEERFNREKHTGKLPAKTIDFCLSEAGITINDVQHIGFSWRPVKHLVYRIIDLYKYFPDAFIKVNIGRRSIFFNMINLKNHLKNKYKYRNGLHFVDHQLCHAASTYYTSPFKDAAILVLEANSERETTLFATGKGNNIKKIKSIRYPNSIGLLYLCVTEYLGFKENSGEGKVMGLAPYGIPTYYDKFNQIIKLMPELNLFLDMSYFDVHLKKETYVTDKFIKLFGPRREPESKIKKRHMDIAASLQKITEDICIQIVDHLYDMTGNKNLCLSGGVALNSVLNGKLQKYSKFKNIYIPPVASDVSTSSGGSSIA